MVDKKANAKTLMNIFFGVILIIVLGIFVFATTAFDGSIINYGNYSTTLFLNVSTSFNSSGIQYNMTCFYNASGGPANVSTTAGIENVGNLTGVMSNQTSSSYNSVFNISVDISWLNDSKTYNISCWVNNGTHNQSVSQNITIDNTPPGVNFSDTISTATATGVALVNYGNYSAADVAALLNINVSASDAIFPNYTQVWINISNSSGYQLNLTRAWNMTTLVAFYNASINVSNSTLYPDAKYNITICANDSVFNNFTGTTYTNLNNSEYLQITIDRTAPSSVTLVKKNSTRNSLGIDITIVDATSGIASACTVAGTGGSIVGTTASQTLVATGLGCSSSYSYIVTCKDVVGYSKSSSSYSFMTSPCSSSGGNGGSQPTIESTHSWASISPGAPALMGDFEEDVGVEQIRIEVRNEVTDVRMIVSRHQSNPSTVHVEQSEQIYRYLEIEARNLGEDLEKATVRIQVEKTWISNNNISKNNVKVFKIGEEGSEWEELVTTYLEEEEDDTYYYYDIEVTSFSYFAIGEKVVEEEPEEPEPTERNLLWLWIVIGVVIVAIVAGGGLAAKKRR